MQQLRSKCTSFLGLQHDLKTLKLVHRAPETRDHQADITVAGDTASCYNDNPGCHRRRQAVKAMISVFSEKRKHNSEIYIILPHFGRAIHNATLN